jgi:carbamoyltransferase
MYILGVNSGWHDSSAALLKDGQLLTLIEHDRVSRKKHAMGEAPAGAIEACLRDVGITLDDVEAVAVGWDDPVCIAQKGERYDASAYAEWLLPADRFARRRTPPIEFVPHHLAHAASGMWTSGFDRAAVLVIDGRGETQSTSLGVGTREGIEWLQQWDISQSLGNFYGYAAEWAGFTFWGPGKLMGLASYGRPDPLKYLTVTPSGYQLDGGGVPGASVGEQEQSSRRQMLDYFSSLYPFAPGDPGDIMAYAQFAASVQAALEQAVFQLARLARDRAGADALVITGGVGLNCTMNGRFARSGLFSDIYVPPVTHDTGVSLGAALVADRRRSPGRPPMGRFHHAYWGVRPSADAVTQAAEESGLSFVRLTEDVLVDRVVEHLMKGRIVGWFQGRAEIGQRALGARSMLGDPRKREHLVRMNTVKGREIWRPLAPSVLEEHAHGLFDGALPPLTKFMLAALPVRDDARRLVPATVHVDGSARPQAVSRATNPRYWRLIDGFRQRTGVPAVVNTSFNLAGEPIVHTPADAISSFRRSDIDVLALEDCLFEKPAAATA